jgi:hypothetical protein
METPTTAAVLARARGLVSQGWTQGVLARDRDGFQCSYRIGRAERFCAIGAIAASAWQFADCDPAEEERLELLAEQRLLQALPRPRMGGLATWNDATGRTKEEVLAAFDAAIAEAGDA